PTAGHWSARKCERARRSAASRTQQADIAEAVQIIEAWNERLASGRRALFSPTIGAAAIPGCPVADDVYRVQPGERAAGRQVRHDSAAMRLLPIETSGGRPRRDVRFGAATGSMADIKRAWIQAP